MDAERERKTRELLAGASSRSQARRIAVQRESPPAETFRVDVLCGCGWGLMGVHVTDGEIINCSQCGTELGHE